MTNYCAQCGQPDDGNQYRLYYDGVLEGQFCCKECLAWYITEKWKDL